MIKIKMICASSVNFLEEKVNNFFEDKEIERRHLIDIKYQFFYIAKIGDECHEAMIIYEHFIKTQREPAPEFQEVYINNQSKNHE